MNQPVRLLIHGASGRMGLALLRLASQDRRLSVVAAVSSSGQPISGVSIPVIASANLDSSPDFDVAIDFSLPAGFDALLALCQSRGAALVCGTTGLSESQNAAFSLAGASIAVLSASNFSLGVAVLEDLVRRASTALDGWQVDILESHHSGKKDAPSGTALTLARAAALADGTIPDIRSVREGEIIGEHSVRFVGAGENVELIHRANDRDIFAHGALQTALWLAGKPPGNYRLASMLFGRSAS